MEYFLASDIGLVTEERRISNEHFKENDSYGPPIDGLVVSLLGEDFGGDVVGSAYSAEGELSPFLLEFQHFLEIYLLFVAWLIGQVGVVGLIPLSPQLQTRLDLGIFA